MRLILYIILILTIFIACEKEVYIPIEHTESKLVVNALFNTDSLWSMEISASKYIYDTAPIPLINDAQVMITNSGGTTIQLTNQGDGMYTSLTETPVIGELYTLNVSHSNYDDVCATNQLPGAITFVNVAWDQQAVVAGEVYRRIDITFQDSPENDYYMVRLKGLFERIEYDEDTWEPIDTSLIVIPLEFFSQNAAVENSNPENSQESVAFTDDIFNGTQFTFDILASEYYFNGDKESIIALYISMSRISEEYYWYKTSYQAYLAAQGNIFGQPVQVYTNIENGLGIFSGYSTTVDTISFQ